MPNDEPLTLMAVLLTLAICPTRQSVRVIVDLCAMKPYSEEEWNQICDCANDRLRTLHAPEEDGVSS